MILEKIAALSSAAIFACENHLAKNKKMWYTYDKLSRVTKTVIENTTTSATTEETYTYDAASNVTSCTAGTDSDSFVYSTNNRLTSYNSNSVSYDLDGNMTYATLDGEAVSLTYDSANRLTSAGCNTYTYNVDNTRIRSICGENITTYVYNTVSKLSTLLVKTMNGVTTKYVYGKGLIGEETAGIFKTYHFDYRGSTVALTSTSGTVTDTFTYDTYGKLTGRTGATSTPFMYDGRDGVLTDSNGLLYMRARYYSPELRRFVNADIIAGNISNAITLNRYAYANGNPVSNIDPFGLSAEREDASEKLSANLKEIFDMLSYGYSDDTKEILSAITSHDFELYESSVYYGLDRYYFSISATLGSGDIDLVSILQGQYDSLQTINWSKENFSQTLKDGSVTIKYSVDLNDNNTVAASLKISDTGTINAEYNITTNYEGASLSLVLGVEKTMNDVVGPKIPVKVPVKDTQASYGKEQNNYYHNIMIQPISRPIGNRDFATNNSLDKNRLSSISDNLSSVPNNMSQTAEAAGIGFFGFILMGLGCMALLCIV